MTVLCLVEYDGAGMADPAGAAGLADWPSLRALTSRRRKPAPRSAGGEVAAVLSRPGDAADLPEACADDLAAFGVADACRAPCGPGPGTRPRPGRGGWPSWP